MKKLFALIFLLLPVVVYPRSDSPLLSQTPAQAAAKSNGCLSCHKGIEDMHASPNVRLGCIDCHGGNNDAVRQANVKKDSDEYTKLKDQAHPKPKFPEKW